MRERMFSVEAEEASFESLAVSKNNEYRTLEAKLADALLVRSDLVRRLADMNGSLAKHGLLAGPRILFLIYKEFGKNARQIDCTSYSHLQKTQGVKISRVLKRSKLYATT